jgi:hypothetical protein
MVAACCTPPSRHRWVGAGFTVMGVVWFDVLFVRAETAATSVQGA